MDEISKLKFNSYFNNVNNTASCTLLEDRVVLTTAGSGYLHRYYSDKTRTIMIKDIRSVVLRGETSWLRSWLSYIQFLSVGSNERVASEIISYIEKHPIVCYDQVDSLLDNGIVLLGAKQDQVPSNIRIAEKIKNYIEKYNESQSINNANSIANELYNELLRLKSLVDKGILTDDEFIAAKRKLLNM